jgi:hypothetical protein
MDFRARHCPDRRGMFVVLPVSFSADHDDFPAAECARLVIVLPVIGDENFEDRPRAEPFPRRGSETEQAAAGVGRNSFRNAGLEKSGGAKGEKAF